jgi:hypothetical protein
MFQPEDPSEVDLISWDFQAQAAAADFVILDVTTLARDARCGGGSDACLFSPLAPDLPAVVLDVSIYTELGDADASVAALERSVAEHEVGMELFGLDPIFDPIRETPRFRAVIARMRLTEYHARYGRGRARTLASPSQSHDRTAAARRRVP